MLTIAALIKRHPAPAYFTLAFAISWGGVLIVIVPGGIPGVPEENAALFPFAYLAMLAGSSVAGLLLTSLVHGRAGFRELRSQLLTWRVGARWYAIALLTAPLVATTVLLGLSLANPIFLPAFRVLMVWVYDRTGSLLVAMLMHVSLTSSLIILRPPASTGASLLTHDLVLAIALWVVVGAVMLADRRKVSRQVP